MRFAPIPFRAIAALALVAAAAARTEAPAAGYAYARETAQPTALDRYVAAPDPSYAFALASQFSGEGYESYVLDLTSQTWRAPGEVDRTVWKHWLSIAVPAKVESTTAVLFIGGGKNGGEPPRRAAPMAINIAKGSGCIAIELGQIPNQPLVFGNDGRARSEDAMIAYTWDKFLQTGDDQWPARLPMTKAVVRAMDAVQAFLQTPEGGGRTVDRFVVAGGSKRGWTTWTTGAVDTRVVGIVPAVIDLLDIVPSFEHHWRAYGAWAPAIGDYVELGIMEWLKTPEFAALMQIVEPYTYRNRLTIPKYIVNACGDEFFVTDSSRFYWDGLPAPKYLRYVPNVGHGLGGDAVASVIAFAALVAKGQPLPRYSWTVQPDGSFRVESPDAPRAVSLWQATNPEARTFRIDVAGKIWTETPLAGQGGGVYVGGVAAPERGWTAYMVELTFDTPSGPVKFTTPTRVVPDTMPHEYLQPPHPAGGFLQPGN